MDSIYICICTISPDLYVSGYRWHRVVISHRGQEVDVTLDSGTQRMQAREGHQHLHMDPAVFFGGMEMSHTGLGISFITIFTECVTRAKIHVGTVVQPEQQWPQKVNPVGSHVNLCLLD